MSALEDLWEQNHGHQVLTQTWSLLVRHLTQSTEALRHSNMESDSFSWLLKQLGGIFSSHPTLATIHLSAPPLLT